MACNALLMRISSDESADALGAAGTLEPLLTGLAAHPGDAVIQDFGCELLGFLARGPGFGARARGVAGVPELLWLRCGSSLRSQRCTRLP